jgi:LPS sulfotransferase NodH
MKIFGSTIDPAEVFGTLSTILIRRADRVAQAVSYARGLQTGQWSKEERATQEPWYDEALIHRCFVDIAEEETAWQARATARGEPYLEVVYEDFIGDYEGTVRRVLEFLGVDAGPAFLVPPPPMERQADALNEAWCARFRDSNAMLGVK